MPARLVIDGLRLHVALLAGTISCGLLLMVGALFWQLADRLDLQRVDREIRNLCSPQLDRVHGPSHWERFEAALEFVAGSGQPSPYRLLVQQDGREVYRSLNWPVELAPGRFPRPSQNAADARLSSVDPRPAPPRREPISPQNPALPHLVPAFATLEVEGRPWRVGVLANPYIVLTLAADLNHLTAGTSELRRASLLALPLVLFLVGCGSWLVASRALRPLTLLTDTVEQITARGLDRRIPLQVFDREIRRLVAVLNEMLERLETSFEQATRFSADAAHELRTPLTVIQGELELALAASSPGSEQECLFERLIAQMVRLRAVIEKLLLLAQADAGSLPLDLQPVSLSRIVQDAAEDLAVLAPGVSMDSQVEDGVTVRADSHLLAQVVQNLTTNAGRYTTPAGHIDIDLRVVDGKAALKIGNSGEGIPAPDRDRIFDRFYRPERSRSRELGGVGLGLSLAREIARAHGGDLVLEESTGQETRFQLVIPTIQGEPGRIS